MQERCPEAVLKEKGYLNGYALEFRGGKVGFLTIKKENNSKVPISLWMVKNQDRKYLDIYEGLGQLYYKEDMVCNINGNEYNCFAYFMYGEFKTVPPSYDYLRRCAAMYYDEGFEKDIHILEKAYMKTIGG